MLGELILGDDPNLLTAYFAEQRQRHVRVQQQENARLFQLQARLAANPMDLDAQRQLEEEIHKKNIKENLENAVEHMPESFAQVVMLYVPAEVNGHAVTAFVDSGAQTTIMGKKTAERLNLLRLCDRNFAGIAKGVGTQKIIGRVHMANIKLGNSYFPFSVTILEGDDMEFLFGLDMLRRHQACIDLKSNVLSIGKERVHFLHEKDIPQREKNFGARSPKPATKSEPLPPPAAAPTAVPAPSRIPVQGSAPPPAGTAAPRAHSAPPQSSQFPEHSIGAITRLGFTRQQATQALSQVGGNAELAASLLFQQQHGW